MSLLMEALKKAEQAKRKAAEASDAAPPVAQNVPASPPPSSGLTLELAPTEPVPPKAAPVYATEPPAAPPPAQPKMTTIVERAPPVAAPEQAPKPELKMDSAPVTKPAATAPPPAPVATAPAVTLPATKAQAKPAVAQDRSKRAPRALLWPALGFMVVFLMGSGGYWYYNSMSDFLQQQTTQGMPQTEFQSQAPETVAEPAPVIVDAIAPNPVAKKPVARAPRRAEAVALAAPPVQAAPAPVEIPAAPAMPLPINVTRNVDQTEIFNLLQQAYRHYQNSDDTRAQVLYAQVLGHEENNRDALLGLAAIAVRQRDTLKAQEIYNELLALDPRDTVAQAGFVGVTRSLDPLQQEARVKQLLESEPNSPHLLFTYATFLMQQQRWSEASRALQSALQSQRDNPDYAFNLAVTLDHQGQNANALKYYRLALDLTSQRAASFRVDDVRRRIGTLEAPRDGGSE